MLERAHAACPCASQRAGWFKIAHFGDRPLCLMNELRQIAPATEATGSLWASVSSSVKWEYNVSLYPRGLLWAVNEITYVKEYHSMRFTWTRLSVQQMLVTIKTHWKDIHETNQSGSLLGSRVNWAGYTATGVGIRLLMYCFLYKFKVLNHMDILSIKKIKTKSIDHYY